MTFLIENIYSILLIIMAFQNIAKLVVNYTDTPVDNLWVSKFYKVIEAVAGIWTAKAKR